MVTFTKFIKGATIGVSAPFSAKVGSRRWIGDDSSLIYLDVKR
jgi:hypothetical protein